MARLYWFVLAAASIKPEASLTGFIAALREAKVELVDYEEETRRVLHRVPFHQVPFVKMLWDKYASTVTMEFKASGRAPALRTSLLRKVFGVADETPSAQLVLWGCDARPEYSVFAELRRGRMLAKLCRREALEENVTMLPPSLCVWVYPDTQPEPLMEAARECITRFYERLRGARNAKT